MIFDTHAHYDDESFDADREELIESLSFNGVGAVTNSGADMDGCRASLELSRRYPFFYASIGVHPDECACMDEAAFAELKRMAEDPRAVAVGEIGLDYHGFDIYDDKPPKELQQKWFRRQLELAVELDKPVVIHSRNACEDTLEMMKRAHEEGLKGGIIHCFSYSKETALQYLDMGFCLGIGGVLTYSGQKKLNKVLEITPMEQITLETDCPYLAPEPDRHRRNCSIYLKAVVARLAEIKGISEAEVERITWENACRVYGLH